MTIKNLYPRQRPSIIYNVINGRPELPVNGVYAQASETYYYASDLALTKAGVNEPRFSYNLSTQQLDGLTLEGEVTNLVPSSNVFTALVSTAATIEPNTADTLAPEGTQTASKSVGGCTSNVYDEGELKWGIASVFIKKGTCNFVRVGFSGAGSNGSNIGTNLKNFSLCNLRDGVIENPNSWSNLYQLTDGWYLYTALYKTNSTSSGSSISTGTYTDAVEGKPFDDTNDISPYRDFSLDFYIFGAQYASNSINSDDQKVPFLYFPNSSNSLVPKAADSFSLTTSSNFDNGFSLLLDSETTTQDFLYKIKASGTEIASLTNNGGTLKWDINGKSAQTNGEYPQVGFLPGRVRTVSSFGPAGTGDVENYLYTTGISFPTTAEPAAGANQIEFGVPQFLKALYVWDGQLDETNAVSLIRGQYNVVPNEPIDVDSYSFVYNTDPDNDGEDTISLPYIVPTVGMTIDWGDGNSNAYEQGVTPSHTYPYPGQYRIQITADDGFDSVRLSDVFNTIYLVDQYAPQHRVGASGPGFTGDDLENMFNQQDPLKEIPPFKHSGLTNLYQAFFAVGQTKWNNWDWVPVDIPEVTTLFRTFASVGTTGPDAGNTSMAASFPQLQTSNKLENVYQCFFNLPLTDFKKGGVSVPAFSDSSGVKTWDYCFAQSKVVDNFEDYDYSSAETLEFTWRSYLGTSFPAINLPNSVTSIRGAWLDSALTTFPSTINTANVKSVSDTWRGTSITNFPQLNLNSAESCQATWYGMPVVSFPDIPLPKVSRLDSAWYSCINMTSWNVSALNTTDTFAAPQGWMTCSKLTSFPNIDMSKCNNLKQAWRNCTSLTSFPPLNLNSCSDASYAWNNCQFPVFPSLVNAGNVLNWTASFSRNNEMTEFNSQDFSNAVSFYAAWDQNGKLATFPAAQFDTTGALNADAFKSAFFACALTATSIENILVSLDTNGQSNIELGIDGGSNAAKSTWTAAANTAYTNLINKGWTITFNP